MQAVVIPLRGGQEVQAEPGALLYMAGDVEMQSAMKGGLWASPAWEGRCGTSATSWAAINVHTAFNLVPLAARP